MSDAKTSDGQVTAETLDQATALLSGGNTQVAKAATPDEGAQVEKAKEPDEKDKDKDKEKDKDGEKPNPFEKVEKSVTFTQAELSTFVQGIVSDTAAVVRAEFDGQMQQVSKGIAALGEKVDAIDVKAAATMRFQGATVDVLKGFKAQTDEQVAVTKGIQAQVAEIADQPAGKKSGSAVDVQKGLQPSHVDMQPLMDWARTEGLPLEDSLALKHNASLGNYAGIPVAVRKSMGVEDK